MHFFQKIIIIQTASEFATIIQTKGINPCGRLPWSAARMLYVKEPQHISCFSCSIISGYTIYLSSSTRIILYYLRFVFSSLLTNARAPLRHLCPSGRILYSRCKIRYYSFNLIFAYDIILTCPPRVRHRRNQNYKIFSELPPLLLERSIRSKI